MPARSTRLPCAGLAGYGGSTNSAPPDRPRGPSGSPYNAYRSGSAACCRTTVYLRYIRPGKVLECSAIGFVLVMASIFGGQAVSESASWGPMFTFSGVALAGLLIGYGISRERAACMAVARTARLPQHVREAGRRGQHSGTSYRSALTALTLMGGLASTVFWPTSLKGLEWYGWRDTMVFFALLQVCVCLPLHLAFVPRDTAATVAPKAGTIHGDGSLPAQARRVAFVGLACAFALNGFVVSVLTVHLISLLQRQGMTLQTAVWVGSFSGRCRWPDESWNSRSAAALRRAPSACWHWVFSSSPSACCLRSMARSLWRCSLPCSSVSATVSSRSCGGPYPPELFGRMGYGRILGNLAAPALVARAIAPVAYAPLALPQTAPLVWLLALLGMALLSLASFAVAIRRRQGG